MTPFVSFSRPRREFSFFLPLLLFAVGLGVLLWTLPMAGVRIPGMARVERFVDSIPFPWKPPKPVYVPLPESAGVSAPAAEAPSTASAPAATSVTSAVAPATSAPPVAAAPHPAVTQPLPSAFQLQGFRH